LTSNIHFKTPKQEIYDNTQNELNGIAQHVIKEIKFPFIVKPRTAAFTSNCHIMAIVVNEEGFYNAMKEKDFK
jgi:inositol-1,3,4-trisphosphate 5/6-kinase/inositol-tetrakisphosphate 1-kinase